MLNETFKLEHKLRTASFNIKIPGIFNTESTYKFS
jgi:hypothetical protein